GGRSCQLLPPERVTGCAALCAIEICVRLLLGTSHSKNALGGRKERSRAQAGRAVRPHPGRIARGAGNPQSKGDEHVSGTGKKEKAAKGSWKRFELQDLRGSNTGIIIMK
ncbi:unnamed protein product, partial [Ectocarpus sp. 12 AP-2014]